MIHIDGSHECGIVKSDLLLAQNLLVEGGVVILDDIRAPHTPGVPAAAWAAVANNGLRPLLYTEKLYASWGSAGPIDLAPLSHEWSWTAEDIAGFSVAHVERSATPAG